MKALQLVAPGNLALRDVLSRPLESHEVRVKVAISCVCGSDLKNSNNPIVLPQVPGHEFSGRITEIGPGSLGKLALGDRITAFPMFGCMTCAACRAGHFRDCENKLSLGFHIPGSFAEEIVIDERFAVKIPPALSDEQGALVEHLCCGYRLAREIEARVPERNAHIVIIGDGPIAMADVQALRLHGYGDLTLLGKHASRLRMGLDLGARRTALRWENSAEPVDICIFAAPAEETFEALLPSIKSGGVVFPQTKITNPRSIAAMQERAISSGRAFAYEMSDFQDVMDLIEEGRIRTAGLITTRIPLSDVPQRFAEFFNKERHFKIAIISDGA